MTSRSIFTPRTALFILMANERCIAQMNLLPSEGGKWDDLMSSRILDRGSVSVSQG